MSENGNRGYGNRIAKAVLEAIDSDRPEAPTTRSRSWLSSWIEPAPARDRSRAWLSMGLKGATEDVSPDRMVRYLREMGNDVTQLGTDEAIDRFVDKLLPKILSNEPPTDAVRDE